MPSLFPIISLSDAFVVSYRDLFIDGELSTLINDSDKTAAIRYVVDCSCMFVFILDKMLVCFFACLMLHCI